MTPNTGHKTHKAPPPANRLPRISLSRLTSPSSGSVTSDYPPRSPWDARIVVYNGSGHETGNIIRRIAKERAGTVPVALVGCSFPDKA